MEENGVWRTVGGRRIFIKEGQDLASAMKESKKFKTYKEEIKKLQETVDKYGSSSQKVYDAIEEKKKIFSKIFKNKEEEETYFAIKKILDDEYIPQEAKNEILKFKVINQSPYSDSFYNAKDISWDSKPEGSIRISDHWNFESQGSVHCKLKGINEYTTGWKMAKYKNGEYIIMKEIE